MPDGKFVGLVTPGDTDNTGTAQVNVVLNWVDELKARVSPSSAPR